MTAAAAAAERDHDVHTKTADIAKAFADSPRPHANGCVGCRRAGTCVSCGSPSLRPARCLSGACPTCCEILHTHVGGDRDAVCTAAVQP